MTEGVLEKIKKCHLLTSTKKQRRNKKKMIAISHAFHHADCSCLKHFRKNRNTPSFDFWIHRIPLTECNKNFSRIFNQKKNSDQYCSHLGFPLSPYKSCSPIFLLILTAASISLLDFFQMFISSISTWDGWDGP